MHRDFESEAALVRAFVAGLMAGHDPTLPATGVVREFAYVRGTTDVVSISSEGEVVAFEAKLTRWRDALVQAYRNTCFAHRSFVVLPWYTAQRASVFCGEFQRRGVGICAIQHGRVIVVRDAEHRDPVEPWLSVDARAAARRNAAS